MATSHSDGFAHRIQGVGKGEPGPGFPPELDEPAVSNKTTAGLLPPQAPVFASSLEQEGPLSAVTPKGCFPIA